MAEQVEPIPKHQKEEAHDNNGASTTMTYPMASDPNVDTQTATHTASPAAMTFPPNMTAKLVNGKKTATRIVQPFKTKWEALNAIASTTPANDGVGGMIKRMRL